ncbi:MAG: SCO1664 family protein [Dehalococcoidia bacterium]
MTDGGMDFDDAERLLEEAEFEDCRSLWYSSNYVFLAQMCAPGGVQFAAVYKPLRGETPLWDFPEGELYKREVAAYRLARLLEWPFVPPTVVRDGPEGPGSLQVYVKHDQQSHFFVQREVPELVPQLKRMCVYDYVSNNADRKGGHCLLDGSGRIWGIDHGLCFHPQYKLRSVMWDWAGEAIPDEFLDDVERVRDALVAETAATAGLRELLTTGEITAMGQRMTRLLKDRTFPQPGPHRSHPWPLV